MILQGEGFPQVSTPTAALDFVSNFWNETTNSTGMTFYIYCFVDQHEDKFW